MQAGCARRRINEKEVTVNMLGGKGGMGRFAGGSSSSRMAGGGCSGIGGKGGSAEFAGGISWPGMDRGSNSE